MVLLLEEPFETASCVVAALRRTARQDGRCVSRTLRGLGSPFIVSSKAIGSAMVAVCPNPSQWLPDTSQNGWLVAQRGFWTLPFSERMLFIGRTCIFCVLCAQFLRKLADKCYVIGAEENSHAYRIPGRKPPLACGTSKC